MSSNNLFSKIKNISKKSFALAMVPVTAVAIASLVTNIVTANEVLMEGHTKSLNVTKGETTYQDSTNAMVDEVVQVELWYHNRELPDATQAMNTRVKFDVPAAKGKVQNITGTTTADNANTVQDTTTVNLSLDRAHIEFISGSAKWRYNKGAMDGNASCQTGMNFPPDSCYATVPISDDVVKGPTGVNLGSTPGCNAYHATVTIQVRVKADVVSVNKFVRHKGQGADAWKTDTTAKPGDHVEYLIRFKNEGNTLLSDVMVGDNLPKYNTYVENTTWLQNGVFPNGTKLTNNNITRGGINVGNYMPGATGYVWFEAKLDPISAYEKCGIYDIRNVGVVRPAGMNEFYNTASVKINVECAEQPEKPAYSCDSLTATKLGGRKVKYEAKATAAGGAKIERYRFNFGDGTTELVTDKNVVEHTYAKDGQYAARVRVEVRVDGQLKIAEGDQCAAVVNFTTPSVTKVSAPTQLPETGPAGVATAFVGISTLGTLLFNRFGRRS